MSPECIAEFNDMKNALLCSPCRLFSVFTYNREILGPFILTTNYSEKGMSVNLLKVQEGGKKDY